MRAGWERAAEGVQALVDELDPLPWEREKQPS